MVIVSQDKTFIVNFNNVDSIEIGNIEDNQGKGVIYARFKNDYFYKLGLYETEERAIEVLSSFAAYAKTKGLYEDTRVFYMPKN